MELKYAVQCLDVLSKDRMTYRQKQAWQTVKDDLAQQHLTQQGNEPQAEIASALNEIEHGLNDPMDVRCIKNGISRIRRLLPC